MQKKKKCSYQLQNLLVYSFVWGITYGVRTFDFLLHNIDGKKAYKYSDRKINVAKEIC